MHIIPIATAQGTNIVRLTDGDWCLS